MKTDRMGVHVKRNSYGIRSRFLRIVTDLEQAFAGFHEAAGSNEHVCPNNESTRFWWDLELEKNKAIEFARRFQNR